MSIDEGKGYHSARQEEQEARRLGAVQEVVKPGDSESISKAKMQYLEVVSEQSRRNSRKAWKEVSKLLGSGCK